MTAEDRQLEDDDLAGAEAYVRAELVIPADCAGMRLDQALARLLPEHSRARLQRWLRAGAVTLDGAAARPKARVLGGEAVRLDAVVETDERWVPEDVAFEVVFADADLVVVDKPAGLVVHPGAGNPRGTLANGLLHRFPEVARVPRAGIVHRLDKDTSGLLVVARSLRAQSDLVRQLAARSMGREYLALVEGVPETERFSVDAPIGRHPRQRTRMAVVANGREAVTHVRVAARFRHHALLECRLETGRTHQIRVHLAQRGLPLMGDRLYGARGRVPPHAAAALVGAVRDLDRQALHARRLRLSHPGTGEAMVFEAEMPTELAALVDQLRADAALGAV